MDSYVEIIVKELMGMMKKGFSSPRIALHVLIDRTDLMGVLEHKKSDVEPFVRKALADNKLWKCLDLIDEPLYRNAIKYGDWYTLDKKLYCMVCLIKENYILDEVKKYCNKHEKYGIMKV